MADGNTQINPQLCYEGNLKVRKQQGVLSKTCNESVPCEHGALQYNGCAVPDARTLESTQVTLPHLRQGVSQRESAGAVVTPMNLRVMHLPLHKDLIIIIFYYCPQS